MAKKEKDEQGAFKGFGLRFQQAQDASPLYRGLGLHELGDVFGVSHNTIHKWKNGHSLPAPATPSPCN